MAVYVSRIVRVGPEPEAQVKPEQHSPAPSSGAPIRRYSISVGKWLWRQLVNAISGPGLEGGGIDESAFPSGFAVPYKQGSRQVRNLWHEPF